MATRKARAGAVRPARRASRSAAGRAAARGARPPSDISPSRYIARISRLTGREIPGEIDPDELLVHAHRDHHPLEVAAQFAASRILQLTKKEDLVHQGLRAINLVGSTAARAAGAVFGGDAVERRARKLLGVVGRDHYFQFREPTHLDEGEVRGRIERLQAEAAAALRARGRNPRLRVLLTGATGFLGKEILVQAADDRRIEEVVAVVRPESVRDPKTKEVVKVLSPAERGELLLKRLGIRGARARRFRFVAGDIERADLGLAPEEVARLRETLTHVIHCAASVSFDDTYENSFRANVTGCANALCFSLALQQVPGSPFVHHVAIETSYIHGRKKASMAQENGASCSVRRDPPAVSAWLFVDAASNQPSATTDAICSMMGSGPIWLEFMSRIRLTSCVERHSSYKPSRTWTPGDRKPRPCRFAARWRSSTSLGPRRCFSSSKALTAPPTWSTVARP